MTVGVQAGWRRSISRSAAGGAASQETEEAVRGQLVRVVAATAVLTGFAAGDQAQAHGLLGPATQLAGGLFEVKLRTGGTLVTHGPDRLAAPEAAPGELARRPLQC